MSRLIETVAFRVPSGFNAAAEAAAKASGVVVSEFMRQAIQERLAAMGNCKSIAGNKAGRSTRGGH